MRGLGETPNHSRQSLSPAQGPLGQFRSGWALTPAGEPGHSLTAPLPAVGITLLTIPSEAAQTTTPTGFPCPKSATIYGTVHNLFSEPHPPLHGSFQKVLAPSSPAFWISHLGDPCLSPPLLSPSLGLTHRQFRPFPSTCAGHVELACIPRQFRASFKTCLDVLSSWKASSNLPPDAQRQSLLPLCYTGSWRTLLLGHILFSIVDHF